MTKANKILVSELKCRKILEKSKHTDCVYQTFFRAFSLSKCSESWLASSLHGYEKTQLFSKKKKGIFLPLLPEIVIKSYNF